VSPGQAWTTPGAHMGLMALGSWRADSTHLSETMQKIPVPRQHPGTHVQMAPTSKPIFTCCVGLVESWCTTYPQGPLVHLRPRDG
jgi:hypothetical protein